MAWYKLDEEGEIEGLNGGSAPPVVNYVARLDGVSQYWLLTTGIPISAGQVVELSFVGGATDGIYKKFIESEERTAAIDTGAAGDRFRVRFASAKFDGEILTTNSHEIPTSGTHVLQLITDSDCTITTLGSREDGELINLPLLNFRVYGVDGVSVVNEIPLTNKDQGSTQIATAGTVNATMPNYTPDVWEVNPNAS